MFGPGIDSKLEELSEALVLADPEDSADLKGITSGLNDLLVHMQHESYTKPRAAVNAAGALLNDIAGGESEGGAKALVLVGELLSALQLIFRDGRAPDGVEFPSELNTANAEDAFPGTRGGAKIDPVMLAEFLMQQEHTMLDMERLILNLELNHDDETFQSLRRLVHTLKGESGLLGFDEVEAVCHAAEDAMDEHTLEQMIDPLLALKDWLTNAFTAYENGYQHQIDRSEMLDLLANLGEATGESGPDGVVGTPSTRLEHVLRALTFASPENVASMATAFDELQELSKHTYALTIPDHVDDLKTITERLSAVIDRESSDPHSVLEDVRRQLSSILKATLEHMADAAAGPSAASSPPEKVSGKSDTRPNASIDGLNISEVVDETMVADFLARQGPVLSEFEHLVLSLESQHNDSDLEEFQRLLHTLKGESSLLGFSEIESLCHLMEDAVAHSNVPSLVDILLRAKDWLDRTFEAYAGKSESPGSSTEITKELKAVVDHSVTGSASSISNTAGTDTVADTAQAREQLDEFIGSANEYLENADAHILALGTRPQSKEAINGAVETFSALRAIADRLHLLDIFTLATEVESILLRAGDSEISLSGAYLELLFEAADQMRLLIDDVALAAAAGERVPKSNALPDLISRMRAEPDPEGVTTADPLSDLDPDRQLGEILVESGVASAESVAEALHKQKSEEEENGAGPGSGNVDTSPQKLGEILVQSGKASAKDVVKALSAQKQGPKRTVQVKDSVKVDVSRLNSLVDMIGELVIAESMVSMSHEMREMASPELIRHLGQLDKITRELQEIGTTLRLVPLRPTIQKMARLVRDLGKRSGKKVSFTTRGEDTELDKSLVDKIGDPLVHLIRNAVDHGLESDPSEREKAGKSVTGNIELRAFHKAGSIHIEVQDDGRGLDREAILQKAREHGLIEGDEKMEDREVWQLIFAPGFTTAKEVTGVSGRGVGMDVVKRSISDLRGTIEINSERHKGTNFSIRLPLTLAIIDGMLIRCKSERFILPTLAVKRLIRPDEEDYSSVFAKDEVLEVEGRLVPLFHLDDIFEVKRSPVDSDEEGVVVVLEYDDHVIAMTVDEVLGQQQTVIKSLGRAFNLSPSIAGGAILPDGRVGLILDVGGLIKVAKEVTRSGVKNRVSLPGNGHSPDVARENSAEGSEVLN